MGGEGRRCWSWPPSLKLMISYKGKFIQRSERAIKCVESCVVTVEMSECRMG